MQYDIRTAQPEDLDRIEEIYSFARGFMVQNGNPTQWGTTEPPHDQLVADIENKTLYVITEGERIHGVFYFYIGNDPTYNEIYGGTWRSDTKYGTIHRIAGDGSGGILKAAVAFCLEQISHVRIDTHADNTIMQNAVSKLNFHRCGIIYIADGTPRIAYDLLK